MSHTLQLMCSYIVYVNVIMMELPFVIGAVYRYYESRRRILNDVKPSRKEQVAKNNKQRRNRMAQKNVSSKAASYVSRALTCICFSSCSCLLEEADM